MSREAFEHWYADYTGDAHIYKYCDSTGRYQSNAMESAWRTWQAWQAALQRSAEPVVFTCHGNNAPAYGCNKPGDMSGTYYKAPQPVVPDGYRVERGSVTYNEILVTAPDGGQQTFWPDDAAYELIKALLTTGKENKNDNNNTGKN
jgi:hypothetical protein